MKILANAYQILNNILNIIEKYIQINFSDSNSKSVVDYDIEFSFEEYRKLFETYKKIKLIYSVDFKELEINSLVEFYCCVIEQRNNYNGCLYLLKKYSDFNRQILLKKDNFFNCAENNYENSFGSNLTVKILENIQQDYVNGYFEAEDTKRKRKYKMENAGVNWTDNDMKKFNEGLDLYGNCQLANIKIAKFMGSHIEASHIKLFRSKISKEKRKKRKFEKESKISEMKKTRNLKWKAVEGEFLI
jgi:hypothetical protein